MTIHTTASFNFHARAYVFAMVAAALFVACGETANPQMEDLTNELVLVVDGSVHRRPTRFFSNGGSEWIILDNSDSSPTLTHLCMPSGISSGQYDDRGGPRLCVEIEGLPDVADAGGSTADGLVFEIEVEEDMIRGTASGVVQTYGNPASQYDVEVWFGSDRVDSGGW